MPFWLKTFTDISKKDLEERSPKRRWSYLFLKKRNREHPITTPRFFASSPKTERTYSQIPYSLKNAPDPILALSEEPQGHSSGSNQLPFFLSNLHISPRSQGLPAVPKVRRLRTRSRNSSHFSSVSNFWISSRVLLTGSHRMYSSAFSRINVISLISNL